MTSKTTTIIIAIIIAIVIALIFANIIARLKSNTSRETFTAEECGITSAVSIPYQPLSHYEQVYRREGPPFAQLQNVGAQSPANLAAICDATIGCVGFDTYGVLLSGYRPREFWRGTSDKDTYVRKCSLAEPIYIEWYQLPNYTGARWLIPAGTHTNMGVIPVSGIIGPTTILATPAMSIKIPRGISLVVHDGANAEVTGGYVQIAGNWPNFTSLSSTPAIWGKSLSIRNDTTYTDTPRLIAGTPFW